MTPLSLRVHDAYVLAMGLWMKPPVEYVAEVVRLLNNFLPDLDAQSVGSTSKRQESPIHIRPTHDTAALVYFYRENVWVEARPHYPKRRELAISFSNPIPPNPAVIQQSLRSPFATWLHVLGFVAAEASAELAIAEAGLEVEPPYSQAEADQIAARLKRVGSGLSGLISHFESDGAPRDLIDDASTIGFLATHGYAQYPRHR